MQKGIDRPNEEEYKHIKKLWFNIIVQCTKYKVSLIIAKNFDVHFFLLQSLRFKPY